MKKYFWFWICDISGVKEGVIFKNEDIGFIWDGYFLNYYKVSESFVVLKLK